ncbi:MAG: Hsp33 family molecular chaperone HslO [Caldilineaceae bacterium]
MSDYIVRILAKEAGVRGLACVTTELVQDATTRLENAPAASASLGYGLTAAALLGALLKIQQQVAIRSKATGRYASSSPRGIAMVVCGGM